MNDRHASAARRVAEAVLQSPGAAERDLRRSVERHAAALAGHGAAAGVSDAAIADAIHVWAAFNIIDRIADSLHFAVPDAAGFAAGAKRPLRRGYR